MASDTGLAAHARDDGGDIYFTSSGGSTKLSHEIEKFDSSTGNLVAWVKVPNLSSSTDTILYMYYGPTTYTHTYNNLNQLTSRTDGMTTTTYTYDNNGNLTSKGDGTTTYTWNYENKMTNVTTSGGSSTTFAYNPDGLRIKKEDNLGITK